MPVIYSDKTVARFEAKVDRSGGPDACHIWTRATDKNTGYGQFNLSGKCRGAHVIALEMKLGRALLPGFQALHTCDNRPCVNGEHLYEGTQRQNIHDAINRGRFSPPPRNGTNPPVHYGAANRHAVMTEDSVRALRTARAEGLTYAQLAVRWGISKATVAQIVTRRTWKKVI